MQKHKCLISGMPMGRKYEGDAFRSPWNPSIDRIDSSKEYTKKNIQLVCYCVNVARNEWDSSVFDEMVESVFSYKFRD